MQLSLYEEQKQRLELQNDIESKNAEIELLQRRLQNSDTHSIDSIDGAVGNGDAPGMFRRNMQIFMVTVILIFRNNGRLGANSIKYWRWWYETKVMEKVLFISITTWTIVLFDANRSCDKYTAGHFY